MFKRKNKNILSPELDVDFYGQYYSDLSNKTEKALHNHWQQYGKNECRSPNLQHLLKSNDCHNVNEIEFDIDPDFYCRNYKDVAKNGTMNKTQAKAHWLIYGKKEGRARTLIEWMKMHGGYTSVTLNDNDIEKIIELNKKDGLEVTTKNIQDILSGNFSLRMKFSENHIENAAFYERIGNFFYINYKGDGSEKNLFAARSAYRMSINFHSTPRILELFGNTYLDASDFRTAIEIYHEALNQQSNNKIKHVSHHFFTSLAQAESECHLHANALKSITRGCISHPEITHQNDKIDHYANKYFEDFSGKISLLSILDKRKELQDNVWLYTKTIYQCYFSIYGGNNEYTMKSSINHDRILIVGDYHIPQCERYRIDQKAEQLKLQGKVVTCINWMDLAENSNELALHDIIIFYRVPALPDVIKAIAKVNASGKISIFEIDDLLFDPLYPAKLDSYGGYVSLDTHIELRKGMALFYAAARLCSYGLASTLPLCEKLQSLVSTGSCLLHRNGLDKSHIFKPFNRNNRDTIDIFYGSGTQAHNSDFIELALPALTQILQKYTHVRLVIVGFLKLPGNFIERFSTQLKQIPPIPGIKAYSSILQQADINLAVLHDDPINACKSELKWLEAAYLSIPSVVSSTKNYRDVLIDGEDAFLVTSEKEWVTALERLIESEDLRKKIAQNALAKVRDSYSIDSLGWQLVAKLKNISTTNKKKRKIALVNVFFPPQSIGGATRVVADNAAILQNKYKDEIELIVFTSDEGCKKPYQLDMYKYEGINVYRSTVLHRENMDWNPQDPEMFNIFKRFLELEKPDLVHFHCVQRLTGSVVEATKCMGIPYIVTAHDAWWISDFQFLVDSEGKLYKDGHPDRFAPRSLPHNITFSQSIERNEYLNELLLGANELLTVSKGFADIYKKNGFTQIKTNRNGISLNQNWSPKDTSSSEKIICGLIGGMSEHKGYFLFKESIEKMQPSNIAVIVVDHSKDESFQEITYWGIVPVTIIGRVAQARITDLYRKIDVLFAPSIWPESFGLVTREAAACGCWVVASDLGGIGEDLIDGKTGFLIKPNLSDLCEVIKEINNDIIRFKEASPPQGFRTVDNQVSELVGIYL